MYNYIIYHLCAKITAESLSARRVSGRGLANGTEIFRSSWVECPVEKGE